MSRARRPLAWRVLPFAVALLLLGLVAARVDGAAVLAAARRADWARYVPAAAGFTLLWLLIDTLALSRLVSRFHRPVPPRELLPLRAGSYVFLAVSYDAAQAALGLALSRRTGIPLLALGGTFLAWYGVDLVTIAGLGSIGAHWVEGPLGEALRVALPLALVGVVAVATTALALARAPAGRAPAWLRGARVLDTLRRARPRDLLEFVGWRAAFYGSFVAFVGVTLPTFGIHVPWPALLAAVPITMSLAALPITTAGVGSTQVAMLALYGRYADEGALLAYSLVYTASLVLFRLPLGLLFLPAATDRLAGRRPDDAAVAAGDETP